MPARRRRRRQAKRLAPVICGIAALLTGAVLLCRACGGKPLPGDGVAVPDYVAVELIPTNEWSRPGRALEAVNAVVIHYVGNPATTARANRSYFASLADGREQTYASAHFVVGLEGEVIQCVPLTEVAYASNDRNGDTVSVEVCHPDETGKFGEATYASVVELTAWLCRTFDLQPGEAVIRHYDVTGKVCPRYYVEQPEAWDTLKADVADRLAAMAAEARED